MLFGKFGGGSVSWLLVCLGNPGREYAETRHNVGFLAADLLAEKKNEKIDRLKFKALTGTVELGGEKVLVMKPQTYMNLSGEAVGEAARFYKLPPERVLVISDDVSLPLGKMRIRANGSAGGHNGLKNIIQHLGTDAFPRIKVGVGAPAHPEHEMVDWVIGKFSRDERKVLDEMLKKTVDAVECVIRDGVQKAQNRFN
ncbi:MAG: aminoacyl-tRNA hydrolase [Oscillospiraceae bacterium]|nr:aminoacyl-tRNA hydrolase [Oscillospiraceae bacterium]